MKMFCCKQSYCRFYRHAQYSFQNSKIQNNWLDDASTYPLIAILGSTLAFAVGAGIHALVTYNDVQIDPRKRNSIIRFWGEGYQKPLVGKMLGSHTFPAEGLGLSHDEWIKRKKQIIWSRNNSYLRILSTNLLDRTRRCCLDLSL